MKHAVSQQGDEMIVLTRAEFDELLEDAGDSRLIEASYVPGAPALPGAMALAVANGSLHPLTAWRRAAGLTQAALAEKSGQRSATISDIESGKTDPRLSTLKALAGALGLEIGDIVP